MLIICKTFMFTENIYKEGTSNFNKLHLPTFLISINYLPSWTPLDSNKSYPSFSTKSSDFLLFEWSKMYILGAIPQTRIFKNVRIVILLSICQKHNQFFNIFDKFLTIIILWDEIAI